VSSISMSAAHSKLSGSAQPVEPAAPVPAAPAFPLPALPPPPVPASPLPAEPPMPASEPPAPAASVPPVPPAPPGLLVPPEPPGLPVLPALLVPPAPPAVLVPAAPAEGWPVLVVPPSSLLLPQAPRRASMGKIDSPRCLRFRVRIINAKRYLASAALVTLHARV
jgi:hypothetical protein